MTKPLPILSHMPWQIKREILRSTDVFTRFRATAVSKEFRDIVQKLPVHYSRICVTISRTSPSLEIVNTKNVMMSDGAIMGFEPSSGEDRRITFRCDSTRDTDLVSRTPQGVVVTGRFDCWERTLSLLFNLLKNASVGELKIESPELDEASSEHQNSYIDEIKHRFMQMNRKISINYLNLSLFLVEKNIVDIITFLREDHVKNLELCLEEDSPMTQLTETTAWGHLKAVTVQNACSIPVEQFAAISYGIINDATATFEELQTLIDKYLSSTNLQMSCFAGLEYNFSQFRDYLQVRCNSQNKKHFALQFPGTNDYLSIEVTFSSLYFSKVTSKKARALLRRD